MNTAVFFSVEEEEEEGFLLSSQNFLGRVCVWGVGAGPEQRPSRLEMRLPTAPWFVNPLDTYVSLGTA